METSLENITNGLLLVTFAANTVGCLGFSYTSFKCFYEEKVNKQSPNKLDLMFGSVFLASSIFFASTTYDLYKLLVQ